MLKRTASAGYAECRSERMFEQLVRVCVELLEALREQRAQASSVEVWRAQPESRTLLQLFDAAQAFHCDTGLVDESPSGAGPAMLERQWLLDRLAENRLWEDLAVWSGLLRQV